MKKDLRDKIEKIIKKAIYSGQELSSGYDADYCLKDDITKWVDKLIALLTSDTPHDEYVNTSPKDKPVKCKGCERNSDLTCPNGYEGEGMKCCRCVKPQYPHTCKPVKVGWDDVLSAELTGAIARGWCSKENSKKTMDSHLATAILKEIYPVVNSLLSEQEERIKEINKNITKILKGKPSVKGWEGRFYYEFDFEEGDWVEGLKVIKFISSLLSVEKEKWKKEVEGKIPKKMKIDKSEITNPTTIEFPEENSYNLVIDTITKSIKEL